MRHPEESTEVIPPARFLLYLHFWLISTASFPVLRSSSSFHPGSSHHTSSLVLQESLFIQDKTAMLSTKVLALLALFSVSAVLAAPIAGDGLVEKRSADAADYGKYGDYGNYGKYGTYCDCLGIRGSKTR